MLMQLARDQLDTLSNQYEAFVWVANKHLDRVSKNFVNLVKRMSVIGLLYTMNYENVKYKVPDPNESTIVFRLKLSTLEGLGVLPSMTKFMDVFNRKM